MSFDDKDVILRAENILITHGGVFEVKTCFFCSADMSALIHNESLAMRTLTLSMTVNLKREKMFNYRRES